MPRVAECIKLGRALPSQPGLGESTAALWAESGAEEYQAKYRTFTCLVLCEIVNRTYYQETSTKKV